MELGIFLGFLFLLLPLGIPIAFILLLCCLPMMAFMGNYDTTIIGQQVLAGVNSFPLMAIPFFMLAGEIMGRGGLSKKIVDFANISVGRFNGGLGYTAILASIIFSGLSGSPVADAAALGAILVPMMSAKGYDRSISTALICAGAIIAPIIPPSVPMIVLGSSSNISIGRMFMGGIIPGLIIGLTLMFTWWLVVKKHKYQDKVTFSSEEKRRVIKESLPALFLPVLIIGGIRMGIFTPTEAGAFACVYALIISLFVYKSFSLKDLVEICVDSGKSTATVMFIVGAATVIGWLITVAQVPAKLAVLMGGFIHNPLMLMLLINIFFVFIGMVMDLTPNLLIFGPVLVPIAVMAGIDPVYFGIVMVYNLCLGLITPPVGTILYLGTSVGQTSFGKLVRSLTPFLVAEFALLLLFIVFPQLIIAPMQWFI